MEDKSHPSKLIQLTFEIDHAKELLENKNRHKLSAGIPNKNDITQPDYDYDFIDSLKEYLSNSINVKPIKT